jgi:hypothetical protein
MASPTRFANTVSITGTTDAVQLSIRANGTQNSNVVEVYNSSGTLKFYASNSGNLYADTIYGNTLSVINSIYASGASSTLSLSPWGNASLGVRSGTITGIKLGTGSQTNLMTNGTFNAVAVNFTYNQTNSATTTNTDLLISRTETAIGSGPQKLIDAQVGGVSRFSVDNKGSVTISSNLTVQGDTTTKAIFATGASNTNVISGKENATQTEDSFAMYSSAGVKQLGYKSGSMTLAGTMTNTGARINGNLTVTNLFYLSGTNSWLFSNGTNLFFRNVNNVTNAITAN